MGGLNNMQSAQTGDGLAWALLALLALCFALWRVRAALTRFDELDLGLGYDASPAPALLLAWPSR